MASLKDKPKLWKPFIQIDVTFRKTVSLKTFPWIFPHPHFVRETITFDISNGANASFMHRVP